MILIEHNGERQLVNSLDGYPGCKVIARDVDPPPGDNCRWSKGKWVECPKLKAEAKAKRIERARAMLGEDLIEEIVEEVLRRVRVEQTANHKSGGSV